VSTNGNTFNAAVITSASGDFALWPDDPSDTDLLSFDAVAATVTEALLDDNLDPVALGVSGHWGSGKTTVLKLVEQQLKAQNTSESKVVVVSSLPWRYDPTTGARESLIAEVLGSLQGEIAQTQTTGGKAKELLERLVKRVDWAKAIRLAVKTGATFQIPSIDNLLDLVKAPESEEGSVRGLEAFRDEFKALMASDELKHVRCVVVLVDDLDRCLHETVIDTLEAIRLFLAVPKMSFVIAADEERVADAIRTRFKDVPAERANGSPEEPAKLYLHKIVQTTVPLPALSRFDTEAYLVLLQLTAKLGTDGSKPYVDRCGELRRDSGSLDDLPAAGEHDISEELHFAARLTPILYEKLRGNPRRIKRFLNDLHVRQSIAARRGITLAPEVVAKLMVLEVLLPEGFKRILDWLARNELREQMAQLETAAGRVAAPAEPVSGDPTDTEATEDTDASPETTETDGEFSDDLIRWAKLPPDLSGVDLGPYLHLAAAFSGEPLLDSELPERLRDLAANLLSSVRAEQKSVTEQDLLALRTGDAAALVRHLARAARDRPTEQRPAVVGLLRITRLHPSSVEEATKWLTAIPADEVQPAAVLSFEPGDARTFKGVLEGWQSNVTVVPTRNALAKALQDAAS
jgi:hypothetical protein